jgi:hypothetical protein
MSNKHRAQWLLATLSVFTTLAMLTTPLAMADDDHGRRDGRDGDDHRPQVVRVAEQDNDQATEANEATEVEDEAEHVNVNGVQVARADMLVDAVNNEVAMLSSMDFDRDEDAAMLEIEHVRTVSLSALESGLTASQVTAVSNAVTASSSALTTFLNGGSANANAIDAALSAAGISRSSVQALFLRGDNLVVVTS